MVDYLTTDTLPEIVEKNKQNIQSLISEFEAGGISYKDLVAKVEANAKAVAQAVADAAAAQAAADEAKAKTLTNEAAITAHSTAIRANAAAIADAVIKINANAAAIARIINDGIGGYLGTYRATDGDDFTVLPKSANDKERSITEFPEANEIFYQEWEWKTPGGWTKLGSKTDSHIHSQSAGISLADVAAQQDPKITASLAEAKKYTDEQIKKIPTSGTWTEIKDLWTNPDKFLKYKDKSIRITSTLPTTPVINFSIEMDTRTSTILGGSAVLVGSDGSAQSASAIVSTNVPDKLQVQEGDTLAPLDISKIEIK